MEGPSCLPTRRLFATQKPTQSTGAFCSIAPAACVVSGASTSTAHLSTASHEVEPWAVLPCRWLRMWAMISLCVYGIGTPAIFLMTLGYYRKEIKVDQVLRKSGLGYTRASNPHFAMRRRYDGRCLVACRGWPPVTNSLRALCAAGPAVPGSKSCTATSRASGSTGGCSFLLASSCLCQPPSCSISCLSSRCARLCHEE